MAQRPKIDEETILQRYDSLPPDVKNALIGITSADAIYEIGKKSGLTIEQIGMLAEEIGLITLGFVPAANFISDLKSIFNITEEKAGEIAREANDRVFLPIRESLKRIHGASWADGLTKPPANPPTILRGIEDREKELKPPTAHTEKPQDILKSDGIKSSGTKIIEKAPQVSSHEAETETKIPLEQKPREPLIINPLRDMASPAQRPPQQAAPTIPTRPWETQRTPTAPAILKPSNEKTERIELSQEQPTRVSPPPIRNERAATAPTINPPLPKQTMPQQPPRPATYPPQTGQLSAPQKITVPFTQRIEFTKKPSSQERPESAVPPVRSPAPQAPRPQMPQLPTRPPLSPQPSIANPRTFSQDIESRNKNNLNSPSITTPKQDIQEGGVTASPPTGLPAGEESQRKKPVTPPVQPQSDDPYREPVE